jgi:hypothetical protein
VDGGSEKDGKGERGRREKGRKGKKSKKINDMLKAKQKSMK